LETAPSCGEKKPTIVPL